MNQGEHATHAATLTGVGGALPRPHNDGSGVASASQARQRLRRPPLALRPSG